MVTHSPVRPARLTDRLWSLLTLLLCLLPFNQLSALPREVPRFFLPLLTLLWRASTSVMSLGTKSPMELLLDIRLVEP